MAKVTSLRRMRKNNLIILGRKNCTILCFICWHMSCHISIENVRKIVIYSPNVLIMTVLYFILNFSQYYNNLRFYCAIINWNVIWNIVLNNSVYCDLRNKSVCLNTLLGSNDILLKFQGLCLGFSKSNCSSYAL